MLVQNDMNQQRLNVNDYFSSSDLALITAISLFYPIEAVDRTDPQRVVFFIKRTPGLDELRCAYWKKELKVSPIDYFQQLKLIRTRIREEGQTW